MYARIAASASSSSSGHVVSRWPTKPGRNDGKHSDAHTPLMSMSATRASTSHAPRRISSKRVGSKPYSRRRPADHGVEPDVRQQLAVPEPRLAAVVGGDDARRVVGELRREAAGERVGRLDHVVVDRDTIVAHALARLGLGQERDLGAPALARRRRPRRRAGPRATCSWRASTCSSHLGFASAQQSGGTAPSQ